MHMQSKCRKNKSSGVYFSHRSFCFYFLFPFSFYYFCTSNEKVMSLYLSVISAYYTRLVFVYHKLICSQHLIVLKRTYSILQHLIYLNIMYFVA